MNIFLLFALYVEKLLAKVGYLSYLTLITVCRYVQNYYVAPHPTSGVLLPVSRIQYLIVKNVKAYKLCLVV